MSWAVCHRRKRRHVDDSHSRRSWAATPLLPQVFNTHVGSIGPAEKAGVHVRTHENNNIFPEHVDVDTTASLG